MKRLITLLLALVMAFSLVACGTPAADNGTTTTPQGNNQSTEPGNTSGKTYSFTYGSTKMSMGQDASSIIAALGEPKSYSESESCAFAGLDKTYFYGSFYLQTYPDGDIDRIYCIWFVDDSIATEEGIYIGATQSQVEKAYGAEGYNGSNAYTVNGDKCSLTIILANGVVSSIQYIAVVE